MITETTRLNAQIVFETIRDATAPMTTQVVATRSGLAKSAVRGAVTALRRAGAVESSSSGHRRRVTTSRLPIKLVPREQLEQLAAWSLESISVLAAAQAEPAQTRAEFISGSKSWAQATPASAREQLGEPGRPAQPVVFALLAGAHCRDCDARCGSHEWRWGARGSSYPETKYMAQSWRHDGWDVELSEWNGITVAFASRPCPTCGGMGDLGPAAAKLVSTRDALRRVLSQVHLLRRRLTVQDQIIAPEALADVQEHGA